MLAIRHMQKLIAQCIVYSAQCIVYKESRASRIHHVPRVCAAQLINGLAESLGHVESLWTYSTYARNLIVLGY